jgi:biotin operon repressor
MDTNVDWKRIRANPPSDWSAEEIRLLDLLATGTSTPEIARIMGQHRSMIWRKIQRLKSRVAERG